MEQSCFCGGGDDFVRGGNSTIHGGDGNDTLIAGDGQDTPRGGTGRDVADDRGASDGVQIDLLAGDRVSPVTDTDLLRSVEALRGSTYAM